MFRLLHLNLFLQLLLVMLQHQSLLVVNLALHVTLQIQAVAQLVVLLDLALAEGLRLLRLEPFHLRLLLAEDLLEGLAGINSYFHSTIIAANIVVA